MSFVPLLDEARSRIRPPVVIVLGSPYAVAELVAALELPDLVCYQMDLYQAARLREALDTLGISASVETLPDLWDLDPRFLTALYPVAKHGERELKLDMIEQAYHVLQPGGMLICLSEFAKEQLCPKTQKKVFGRCGGAPARREGSVFWSTRDSERQRRRHEVPFHVRLGESVHSKFLSRPGVFCYGRFDDGSRAMLECADLSNGDVILDLGCGTGAVGILAAQLAGRDSSVTFLDSNLRALHLAEVNANSNGIERARFIASAGSEGLSPGEFDVILANPPYFAQASIATRFAEEARPLLKPGGRFYLVTKLIATLGPVVAEVFGGAEAFERRGYHVLCATA